MGEKTAEHSPHASHATATQAQGTAKAEPEGTEEEEPDKDESDQLQFENCIIYELE